MYKHDFGIFEVLQNFMDEIQHWYVFQLLWFNIPIRNFDLINTTKRSKIEKIKYQVTN